MAPQRQEKSPSWSPYALCGDAWSFEAHPGSVAFPTRRRGEMALTSAGFDKSIIRPLHSTLTMQT